VCGLIFDMLKCILLAAFGDVMGGIAGGGRSKGEDVGWGGGGVCAGAAVACWSVMP
jgi:hypothetical protein